MWNIIWKKIPNFLFEPIAVCALLGLILAFICYYKKHDKLFWFITLSLIFMISWRVLIMIDASRYACILIYPALIAIAYLFCKVAELSAKYLKVPENIYHKIPYFLMAIMMIVCTAKICRFNKYSTYIIESCHIAKVDAQEFKNPVVICNIKSTRRIMYYTKMLAWGTKICDDFEEKRNFENLRFALLFRNRFKNDVIYCFLEEPTNVELVTHQNLGLSEKQWTLISQKYQNKKKRKQLRVYRYIPAP